MKILYALIALLLIIPGGDTAAQSGKRKNRRGSMAVVTPSGEHRLLADIVLEGNRRTRDKVILRELGVQKGDMLAMDSLRDILVVNRLRLINMILFTDAELRFDRPDSNSLVLNVKLKERWNIWPELSFALADRNFNVWWNEQNHDLRRANFGVKLADRNFRGNMEELVVETQIGYTERFGIEYFRPYVDKRQRHGIGVSAFRAQNQEIYYTTDSNKLRFARSDQRFIYREFQAGATYVYRPAYATRHQVDIRYRDIRVDDTIVRLNADFLGRGEHHARMIEAQYRLEHNGVDNWNYPLRGTKLVAIGIVRAGLEGFDFQTKLNVEAGYFRQLSRKWFVSGIFRGQLASPGAPPYYFRTGLGTKTDYVRGYEYYVADGTHYGVLRANLKYELLNYTIRKIPFRYLPVLPLRFYPKVFADIGGMRNPIPGNSFLNNRPLYSIGAGLDFVTTYDFKVRLEFAYNHLGQNGLFLHTNSE